MNVGEMQRKLSVWAAQRLEDARHPLFACRTDGRLHDLYHLLYERDWLRLAYEYVAQNRGSRTAGCDGIDMSYFEQDLEGNLQALTDELRTQSFRPCPVRRVYIPKPNGKLRPLGIPSIRDRIVQEALRMVLEPVFEAEFYRHSYGFRPNRSTVDALAMISCSATSAKKFYWVIEGDIAAYFDTINHEILMRLLRRRIRDKKLLLLVWRFLKAGVMEGKLFRPTDCGTPQGGIVSPLLANVYLHELDMFMAKLTDLPTKDKDERRRHGRPNFVHIRYADDFVVLCNGRKRDAEAMKEKLHSFLSDRLKLSLSKEKTKITHIDDGFKFLGYEIRRSVTAKGRKHPKFLIPQEAKGKLRQTIQRITVHAAAKHSVHAKIHALNRHLRGWANYYRYAYNAARVFAKLDSCAFWQMAHWLGRKYQCSMPTVMRQFKRSVDGVITLGTDQTAVVRMGKIGSRSLQAKCFDNPYELRQAQLIREVLFDAEHKWLGNERRPGMADLRILVLRRDHWTCQACGQPVSDENAQVDHVRPVRRYKRPIDANVYGNLQTLCGVCHEAKTQFDRQMESRMR